MLESLQEIRRINDDFPYSAYLKEAKEEGKKIMGWACNYVPEEIILAAGMVPTRVMGGIGEIKMEEATAFLNIYSCPFTRTLLQLMIEKKYDFLDGFINCGICDGMRRLGDAFPFHTDVPVLYTVSLPHKMDDEAVKFYADELAIIIGKLEKDYGASVTDESLTDAINTYNRSRQLLNKLYSMRKDGTPSLYGYEVQEILNAMMATPIKKFIPMLESIISEIEEKKPEARGDFRLMLSGCVMNNHEFIKGIEDLGGVVVIDALCNGTRYWWGEIDVEGFSSPLEAIADYYLKKFPCPRMYPSEDRFNIMTDLAGEYHVDGMITSIVRYCSMHIFDAPRIRDRIKDMGIPVLTLDVEYGEGMSGQVKTRVQAFMEMLAEKGGE